MKSVLSSSCFAQLSHFSTDVMGKSHCAQEDSKVQLERSGHLSYNTEGSFDSSLSLYFHWALLPSCFGSYEWMAGQEPNLQSETHSGTARAWPQQGLAHEGRNFWAFWVQSGQF